MPLYLQVVSIASSVASFIINIHARAVQAMLPGDVLPEGGTDLVTLYSCQSHIPPPFTHRYTHALAGLKVHL